MKFWNKSFITILILLFLVCSYFLFEEITEHVKETGENAIGTIIFIKKSASRRYASNVIWEDVEQRTEIYNYDAISIPENSSAVIILKDNTKIDLDQNTMIVAILNDKVLSIDLEKGAISVKSGSGANGAINLKTKNSVILLEEGEIAVNSNNDSIKISLNLTMLTL